MDKEEERAPPVQCCFDRVVSEVDPVADSVQRRAGRRRPHQRSFAPNARAPACAPNQTKKTKLNRSGDGGQQAAQAGLIAECFARLTALAGAPQVDPDLNVGWSAG